MASIAAADGAVVAVISLLSTITQNISPKIAEKVKVLCCFRRMRAVTRWDLFQVAARTLMNEILNQNWKHRARTDISPDKKIGLPIRRTSSYIASNSLAHRA